MMDVFCSSSEKFFSPRLSATTARSCRSSSSFRNPRGEEQRAFSYLPNPPGILRRSCPRLNPPRSQACYSLYAFGFGKTKELSPSEQQPYPMILPNAPLIPTLLSDVSINILWKYWECQSLFHYITGGLIPVIPSQSSETKYIAVKSLRFL